MIGVVADDITGANDIGIMFAKSNIKTHVYAYDEFSLAGLKQSGEKPGVVILDTNSRLDSSKLAANKVSHATHRLREAGAKLFINKTCSVFRGNIGAEFDAMLSTLNEDFAVVVLGFPKNGRTTMDGVHYVHGKRLEDSEFRHDPMHPMTKSHLVDILQAQTDRKVDFLSHQTIQLGSELLKERINQKRRTCNYLILDVADQEALQTIATAVGNETVLCGSSALAEELAHVLDIERQQAEKLNLQSSEGVGILCSAGSLMPQTAEQIEYMKEQGVQTFELLTLRVLDEILRKQEIESLTDQITEHLMSGFDAVLHTSNQRKIVEETKQHGKNAGLSDAEVSRLVSTSIAEITAQVTQRTGQHKLVVAGGETSAAVCARMEVRGLEIWKEIEPGLPSCVSLSQPSMLLVLKSGSFGGRDFFMNAVRHLSSQ